ncbi:MAG: tetratricopeptide repeat protein [Candidatus Binatia bacterium]
MTTKLSVWCERIIEAGWLAALITTPLYFNVHSSRLFEPDKIALLRSIALIMVLAWMVKGLENWRGRFERQKREHRSPVESQGAQPPLWRWLVANPLLLLALLFFADYVFATVFSVAPRLSLWGSYERLQGLYTTSAYFVIFFSITTLLRTQEQLERLLTTALVVSLPVALYGIIQHSGVDPVPWKIDVSQRVTSSFGNPIFVAAFLIMTTPLTLYRLLSVGEVVTSRAPRNTNVVVLIGGGLTVLLQIVAWWRGPFVGSLAGVAVTISWLVAARLLRKPLFPLLRLSAYSVVLSAQLACILFTQSRGPWLGLLFSLFLFILLWVLVHRLWRWAALVLGSGCLIALLLTVLILPDSPLTFVRDLPYVGRLGRVFERTGQVRILIWQGTVDLITADPVRAAIGYGPDTLLVAYYPYYSPELAQVESRVSFPDRSHNETFDVLATTGFVGFTLYFLFFTTLIYCGLRETGVVRSTVERKVFLGLWGAGGIGATLFVRMLDDSWRFCGVALPLGMLGGLFVYLGWYGFAHRQVGQQQEEEKANMHLLLLVISLLSALVTHVVEITFGIAIVATRTYFWTYAAVFVAMGRFEETSVSLTKEAARPPRATSRRNSHSRFQLSHSLIVNSLLVGCALMTMVYAFFSPQIEKTHFLSIVWLFTITCLIAGTIVMETMPLFSAPVEVNPLSPPFAKGGKREAWEGVYMPAATSVSLLQVLKQCGVYTGVAVVGTLIFAAVHQSTLLFGSDPAFIPVPYYVFVGLAMLAIGGALLFGEQLPLRTMVGARGLIYSVLAGGIIFVIIKTNVDIVRADIYYRQGWLAYHASRQYDLAIAFGQRAAALTPQQDFYFLFLADVFIEKAKQSIDSAERERLFREAERALVHARNVNPLKLDYTAGLARLHQIWARHASVVTERTTHLQRSAALYQQATALSPHTPHVWNEWGTTHFMMGDTNKALEKYQHSLVLDNTFDQTYLALGALYTKTRQWPEAARAYEKAVARRPESVEAYKALGVIYGMMGRLEAAERQFQHTLKLAPDDVTSHITLAQLYRATGRSEQALAHAQRALTLAPPKERPFLEHLIAQLRQPQYRSDETTPSTR